MEDRIRILELDKSLIQTMAAVDVISNVLVENGIISEEELDARFEGHLEEAGYNELLKQVDDAINHLKELEEIRKLPVDQMTEKLAEMIRNSPLGGAINESEG